MIIAFTAPRTVEAQLPESVSERTELSLLTTSPGDKIYSAFGHSAFRFYDPGYGYDIVFNYGWFDSTDPYFIPKFTYGKLDYLLAWGRVDRFLQVAEIEQRTVVEQTLQLPAGDIAELYQKLVVNARPENRTYRYRFLYENCATILLDRIQETQTSRLRLDSEGGAGAHIPRTATALSEQQTPV